MRRRLLVLLPLLGTCAHRPWEDPGPRWQRVSSQHFIVDTDSAPQDYGPVIERLEDVYSALSKTFFRGLVVDQVHVLLFDRERDFKTMAPPKATGYFTRLGDDGVLVFFTGTTEFDRVAGTAAHELAHRFIHGLNPRAPAWLHEGFAEYVGAVGMLDDTVAFDSHDIGPEYVYFWAPVPFSQLFATTTRDYHGGASHGYYMTAWMLVRYLLARPGPGTVARFQALVRGIDTSSSARAQAAAVSEAVGGTPIAQIEGELRWGIAAPTARHLVGAKVNRSARLPLWSAPIDSGQIRALCSALKGLSPAPPLPEPKYARCYAGYLPTEVGPDGGAPTDASPVPASLDQQELARLVHAQANSLKECYERELAGRADLAGRIVVEIGVAADGSVTRSAIASTSMDAPRVEACVARNICFWVLPRPKDGNPATVRWPFTLRRPGGKTP